MGSLPEVIQTSQMDCGPAALKSLLASFGIDVQYQRLRDACQTDVDGTSIDSLEEIARSLGLDAEQVVLPLEHAMSRTVSYFPAIAVVRLPNGFAHFVVVGRRRHQWFEVMDPASGRKWIHQRELEGWLHRHDTPFEPDEFIEWANSEEFQNAWFERARRALSDSAQKQFAEHTAHALETKNLALIAKLDGALRLLQELQDAKALLPKDASLLLDGILANVPSKDAASILPKRYCAFQTIDEESDDGHVQRHVMRAVVLVRVRGTIARTEELPHDLGAALEPPVETRSFLASFLRTHRSALMRLGWFAGAAALLGAVEVLTIRALFAVSGEVRALESKLLFLGTLMVLLVLGLGFAWLQHEAELSLGRGLELHFRASFAQALRLIPLRYFRSRLVSDLCERAFAAVRLRTVAEWGTRAFRLAFEVTLSLAVLIWLFPRVWLVTVACGLVTLLLPFGFYPFLDQLDHRIRTLRGTLFRYQLDALMGLMPLASHNARKSLLREQEAILTEHVHSARQSAASQASLLAALALPTAVLAYAVLIETVRTGEVAKAALAIFLVLALPEFAREIGVLLPQFLEKRNTIERLVEPLANAEPPPQSPALPSSALAGTRIQMREVKVALSGRTLLSVPALDIADGEHVAIVGRSGAGKSFFVSLLLGLVQADSGALTVDGRNLDANMLDLLRRHTVWIDPAAQLWNESVLSNIEYGNATLDAGGLSEVSQIANVHTMVQTLEHGYNTRIGEGGLQLSGGEGQRLRIARGVARSAPKLVLLDEPFRGLDRAARREMLARLRARYQDVTLLFVTHDVHEALAFGRVLVFDQGLIAEEGSPVSLAKDAESHFSRLLGAEQELESAVWHGENWRHVHLRLQDEASAAASERTAEGSAT